MIKRKRSFLRNKKCTNNIYITINIVNNNTDADIVDVDEREIEVNNDFLYHIVKTIALELGDSDFPESEKYYTISDNFAYKDSIKYNLAKNWFEINLVHFRCFSIDSPEYSNIDNRLLSKRIKNNLQPIEIRRKIVNLEDYNLIRIWKNKNPKVNVYRFNFTEFIDEDILCKTIVDKDLF